ncbi:MULTISPECIES: diacylglycerol/lipid kinase family protein [Pedobacter]|uniref:Diacylglycerol kinase catalytic region n=1 Tax=Pedobacter heparinus (strain ATCC 13125 / DSM 2366 / CIP 104194 / JCM 7457 / NBRC 12017 / NCIMB 9290 / NRRL B-14731 / HIM 762-3) TaxID=485917 RepID=C6XX49_PEDHD|nr:MULTISPECIES: diacylglycerol kinase family protein [Pedobacter]ACU06355.1 diacylglycerol kinase catalytic region [Pedobacter heparinus DSM 2366]MBB5437305.1 YegS/Rv2252/BmrU family lipid kinase [Pedobacter sp. AK017]
MHKKTSKLKLLFIVNPGSGSGEINFSEVIGNYFAEKTQDFEIYKLTKNCSLTKIKGVIQQSMADRVIAVGGDGTLKLVAECVLETNIPIGIIPAGSANGMARELNIPSRIEEALDIAINAPAKKIHAVIVNGELCIHLADIGFNAYLVKKFDALPQRGMLAYAKAAWTALWNHYKMEVEFKIKDKTIHSKAAMVVIANATMYGTGVKINPDGQLDDDFFEVILVKEYSFMEILKLKFTNLPFNPKNIESFQTTNLSIKTRHKAHFQVDGEYIGKLNNIKAHIVKDAIHIIAP